MDRREPTGNGYPGKERLIDYPDPTFSINDREYLAVLLGLSRVPCRLFGDNTCPLWNLLKGKIPLKVMSYLSNKILLIINFIFVNFEIEIHYVCSKSNPADIFIRFWFL